MKTLFIVLICIIPLFSKAQIKDSLTSSMYDACNAGKSDAENYHKRAFGNFTLGLVFGVTGVIGVAAGEPKMPSPLITKRDPNIMMNPYYLECYRRRAKGNNVENAVLGFILTTAATGYYLLAISK